MSAQATTSVLSTKHMTFFKSKQLFIWLLVLLLVSVTLLKLYFVIQAPFPAYTSFYGVRQVEHIQQTGLPFLSDELSYQGRITFEGLFFYFFVAGFSFVVPTLLLFKYASILFSILVLVLVYIITLRLVQRQTIALLITLIASLTPTLFTAYLNTLLPSSLFMILYLLLIFLFFTSNKKHRMSWFVLVLVISTLISSLTLVFIVGFALYFLFLKLESLPVRRREFELLLFSGVFAIWYHLLIYKPLFLQYGAQIIWKTIPRELAVSMFEGLTAPLAISLIGIVPLLLGIHTIYYSLFVKRNRKHFFLIALTFLFGLVTWFGFLPLSEGLFYTTLTLILLSGPSLIRIGAYIEKTIFPKAKYVLVVVLLLVVFINFIPVFVYQPTLLQNSPSQEEVTFFTDLATQLPSDATVLGHISEGHLITSLTQRKNFYDDNFILAPQAQQRYDDAKLIFLSQSQTTILSTLQYYGISHVLMSPLTVSEYPKANTLFADGACFQPVYEQYNRTVYEVTCQLKN